MSRRLAVRTVVDPHQVPIAQWILFVVQVGTLIGLFIYVWKTWAMASATKAAASAAAETVAEMRQARLEASAPRVVVYFSPPDSQLANIVLENLGQTTATDVSLTFDPPIASSFDDAIKFFETPKVLPPHFRIVHLFDSWPQYVAKKLPERYHVTVSYCRGDTGEPITTHQVLDAAGFAHVVFSMRKGTHELVGEIEKLRRVLEQATRETHRAQENLRVSEELLFIGTPFPQLIPRIRNTWDLLRAAQESQSAYPSEDGFLSALRHLTSAALASVNASQNAELCAALQDLYIALSHYRFGTLGSHTEFLDAIEAALKKAEQTVDVG